MDSLPTSWHYLDLSSIHLIFHILMLKKCLGDPLLIVPIESVGVKYIFSYEEFVV